MSAFLSQQANVRATVSLIAMAQLVDEADRQTVWEFLEHLLEVVPYQTHTILTDNGIQFADQPPS